MATASRYLEVRPPRSLSDRVMCLWTQHIDGQGDAYLHPVLPDGCVDIVWIGSAPPVVAGPATRRVLVSLPAGTSLIGMRLRPGWAGTCLGPPADRLLDQEVPLADIWGRAGAASRAGILRRILDSSAADPVALAAVAWIARDPAARVGDLARATGLSGRHLRRRFAAAVGYGPKVFQRVVRFQGLLAAACGRQHDLARLAAGAGYADQAHMCREVRELAGESPQRLLGRVGSTLSMSESFNTGSHTGAIVDR